MLFAPIVEVPSLVPTIPEILFAFALFFACATHWALFKPIIVLGSLYISLLLEQLPFTPTSHAS